jgi:hypothetical protein
MPRRNRASVSARANSLLCDITVFVAVIYFPVYDIAAACDVHTACMISYSPPFPCPTVVGRERGAGTSSTQIVVRARE